MLVKPYAQPCKVMTALLITTLLGATSAYAQKAQFERHKPTVGFGSDAPPLALEIVVNDSGRIEGTVVPLNKFANLTLKRGVVKALPDGGLKTTYVAQITQRTEGGLESVSDLTVQLPVAADENCCPQGDDGGLGIVLVGVAHDVAVRSKTKPEYRYVPIRRTQDAAKSGSAESGHLEAVRFTVTDAAALYEPDVLELRVEPATDTEQLWGEPAYLFELAGPGEALVATVPMPFPGENFTEELLVYSSEDNEPRPVQVQVYFQY